MSLFDVLRIARGAMQVAQLGVSVAGNNTANAATEGYSRQSVHLSPAGAWQAGGLLVGQGVKASDILSAFDRYTESRLQRERSALAFTDALAGAYESLESLFAEGSSGSIGTLITSFFDSFASLSAAPDDSAYRVETLSAASDLAHAISGAASDLEAQRDLADSQVGDQAMEASDIAGRIAQLNEKIASAEAGGATANDLRDERNRLVGDLSQYFEVTTTEEPDGSLTVLVAGEALVQKGFARSLVTATDPSTGMQRVYLQGSAGGQTDLTSRMGSGSIGGLLEVRDERLPALLSQLDQLAYDVSNQVNAVHAAGYGLDGVSGRDLFAAPVAVAGAALAMRLDSQVEGNPDALAAADDPGELPGEGSIASAIADLAEGAVVGGTDSPTDFWAGFIAALGADAAGAYSDRDHQQAVVDDLQGLRDSISGVSLEEEATQLIVFQDSYQAAAQVLSTAQEMLDTLLEL